MKILIVSGLSGSGKSKAASFLEDMGFYIVDNMPAEMILKFAEFCAGGNSRYDRVALVYDIRAGEGFDKLFSVVQQLKSTTDCSLLFMKAEPSVIIRRYKETRRLHPLAEKAGSLEEAVRLERGMMQTVEEHADYVLDTTSFSTAKLRGELLHLFGDQQEQNDLAVSFISFGYKHGLPMEADLVFDVRFMPNPFYIAELRNLTGMDQAVYDYVMGFQQTKDFICKIEDLLQFALPLYREEGKGVLVVAVGCTGGHHRSVTVTRVLAEFVRGQGYQVQENHRDMTRS